MLIDVITRIAEDTGFELEDQRASLINLAYRAAKELHSMVEANRLLREVTLVVPANKLVSLPSFVGEIKGLRQHNTELLMPLHGLMQPRYTSYTEKFKYKNWRDMGEAAVHTIPPSQGKLTFTVTTVESTPVVVKVSGQTDSSIRTEESITINDVSVQTTNLFGPDIYVISCLSPRIYDITVLANDGTELAILYTSDQRTSYKIIDVSELFHPIDTSSNESLIDCCYKVKPTKLLYDTDQFYTNDDTYDDAWYYKAMEIHCTPLQDRQADAAKYKALCLASAKGNSHSQESSQEKKISFGRNKYHGLYRSHRYTAPGACTHIDQ